jgi:hypothetical protein
VDSRKGGGGGGGGGGGHPLAALREVYEVMGFMLSSPDPAGGDAAFHGENHYGLRGGGPRAGGLSEVEGRCQMLAGALRYLESNYWQWLRTEVLPAIQAQEPQLLSGVGGGLRGGIAVDVVRAWVKYFVGDAPEQDGWEKVKACPFFLAFREISGFFTEGELSLSLPLSLSLSLSLSLYSFICSFFHF